VGKEILTYDDLLQIVELIKSAESFSEFHLKIGDIELDLRRSDAGAAAPLAATGSTALPAADAAASAKLVPAPADPVVAAGARATVEVPTGAVAIKSPMVGTFYRSPEPGAKPFVEVGQRVSSDTTVCIIEVMKLMNSISAGCEGTVTHVLANDAEAVDAGQLLIIIDPKA
jgi:acetyl-CoA carboxylase biotin carboxyl carrier protein